MTITPEGLRNAAHFADEQGMMASGDQLRAHASALEELARLKAPVEVAVAIASINAALCGDFLRNNSRQEIESKFGYCEPKCECAGLLIARDALESLAAQVAESREVVEMVDDICELVGLPKERWHGCYQTIAALKGHAEAMHNKARRVANGHDQIAAVEALDAVLRAYRAAYPKADK